MPFPLLALGAALGGASVGFGLSKMTEGGDEEQADPRQDILDKLQWYEDPYYQQTQDVMFPFGKSLLEGKPNDYYAPIGQTGGVAFEDMMRLINRDVGNRINEDLVKRNVRGPLGTGLQAKAMADVGTNLRWSDYLRAIEGKKFLMGTGLNTLGGVQSGALNITGQRNTFNLNKTRMALGVAGEEANLAAQEEANKNAMWSQMLSSGIGAAANIYGMNTLSSALNKTPATTNYLDYGVLNNPNQYRLQSDYSLAGSNPYNQSVTDILGKYGRG